VEPRRGPPGAEASSERGACRVGYLRVSTDLQADEGYSWKPKRTGFGGVQQALAGGSTYLVSDEGSRNTSYAKDGSRKGATPAHHCEDLVGLGLVQALEYMSAASLPEAEDLVRVDEDYIEPNTSLLSRRGLDNQTRAASSSSSS